jgi:hypothetical protein
MNTRTVGRAGGAELGVLAVVSLVGAAVAVGGVASVGFAVSSSGLGGTEGDAPGDGADGAGAGVPEAALVGAASPGFAC